MRRAGRTSNQAEQGGARNGWWMMSNRYGTGKIAGKPVLAWMKVNRVVGTVTPVGFAAVFLWHAIVDGAHRAG